MNMRYHITHLCAEGHSPSSSALRVQADLGTAPAWHSSEGRAPPQSPCSHACSTAKTGSPMAETCCSPPHTRHSARGGGRLHEKTPSDVLQARSAMCLHCNNGDIYRETGLHGKILGHHCLPLALVATVSWAAAGERADENSHQFSPDTPLHGLPISVPISTQVAEYELTVRVVVSHVKDCRIGC